MKRSTPTSASGITLLEVLVALAVASLVVGSALALALSSRKIYELDEARTSINQNLRNALTVIGNDVRQAGERLPTEAGSVFPALEIVTGAEGPEFVIRRNRLTAQPTLCVGVSGSNEWLVIGTQANPPYPECNTNNNTVRSSLEALVLDWRAYRVAQEAQGLQTRAYLYDPISRRGEFFTLRGESPEQFRLRRWGSWATTYATPAGRPVEGQPRLYMLEERRYRKRGEYLQVIVDGGDPQNLIFGVSGFEVRARLQDGSTVNTLSAADDWTQVAAFEVSVTGEATVSNKRVERTLSSEFFPRNALNR